MIQQKEVKEGVIRQTGKQAKYWLRCEVTVK